MTGESEMRAPGEASEPADGEGSKEPLTAEEAQALVAHELRAPLSVIRGYLDILGRPLDEDSKLAALGAATRAAERLDTMLDDLLASSGDRRVFSPGRREDVVLRALAQEVVDEMLPLFDHLVDVVGDEGTVACDPRLIHQALCNLIGNALKHTPPSGRVSVRVAEEEEEVVLLVEDDGPGIPPEERERVFELFARLGSSTDTPRGLGLGLPVARTIVEQHGGTLALTDSCEGTGACFELRLPR
jgi:signal transduction histidine kinase